MSELASNRRRNFRPNWDLLIGAALVFLVAAIAIGGPSLAPHDPLEPFAITKVGDRWVPPPYPALTVPGFPLGTDQVGRDIVSRILWAVQPTMIMVVVVAGSRLILGLLLGLAAGWLGGRLGKLVEGLIAGALAVPVLLVSLWVIAAVGVELGIWAFILGLGVTGWAETARLVQQHVQEIRSQAYVESARALGASNFQVLSAHVFRQLAPRLWTLLSFEVSSTLLVVAGLGFLGYYIGGDVWIEIDDYVAARVTGLPELGQMLASSVPADNILLLYFEPWQMVAVGTVMFVAVLGFQLLGQGLVKGASIPNHREPPAFLAQVSERASDWFEDRVTPQFDDDRRRRSMTILGSAAALVLAIVGVVYWSGRVGLGDGLRPALQVPGEHLWSGERHDPYGTRFTEQAGPEAPEARRVYTDPAGMTGGPAIAADGTLYVGSGRGALVAMGPDGALRWEAGLEAVPFGVPAVGADGTIYVVDLGGGLSAIAPNGDLTWRYLPSEARAPTASPVAAPDGRIFYTSGNQLNAVSPQGEALWQAQALPFQLRTSPPAVSPDGEWVMWEDVLFRADSGEIEPFEVVRQLRQSYLVGAAGETFVMSGNSSLITWASDGGEPGVVESRSWAVGDITVSLPQDIGVAPEGLTWLFFNNSFLSGRRSESRLLWAGLDGRLVAENSFVLAPPSRVIGLDRERRLYLCGTDSELGPVCTALSAEEAGPLWIVPMEGESEVIGGALAPDRLYIVGKSGTLYVFQDP